jgi:uncharacterized protein YjbI with pentapeptide repeats
VNLYKAILRDAKLHRTDFNKAILYKAKFLSVSDISKESLDKLKERARINPTKTRKKNAQ